MEKQELVALLKKEFTTESGNIDISGLDFGNFDGCVILSGIKLKGDISQSHHSNEGHIYQSHHSNKGSINQSYHANQCAISQDCHSNRGNIHQSYHSNKGEVIN
jgi:hypothetical protein